MLYITSHLIFLQNFCQPNGNTYCDVKLNYRSRAETIQRNNYADPSLSSCQNGNIEVLYQLVNHYPFSLPLLIGN